MISDDTEGNNAGSKSTAKSRYKVPGSGAAAAADLGSGNPPKPLAPQTLPGFARALRAGRAPRGARGGRGGAGADFGLGFSHP